MNKKGFSLIEVIIFCFIAITLLTLLVGLAVNSREFARTVGCVNNMKTIAQAVESFQADNKTTPANLADLYPLYVTNAKTFKCPADKTAESNSYEKFYIGRFIASEKSDNVFLACPRHHRKNKTVAAYLSYAVDIGRNKQVLWSGTPAEFGEVYTGGQLTFADGTTAKIESGKAGLVSSFVDNSDKIYSIIYTPQATEGNITVTHSGDSKFEIITPAVIAGVEGTKFSVKTSLTDNNCSSDVDVTEGTVYVEDRSRDVTAITVQPNASLNVAVEAAEPAPSDDEEKTYFYRIVPRKPHKIKYWR